MISKIRNSVGIVFVIMVIGIVLYFTGLIISYKSNLHNQQPTQTNQTINEDKPNPISEDKPNRWKSSDIGVPVGKVTDSGYLEGLPSSNWLSIETPDGISIVIKNLDWQTHSAIKVGDIIE